jgi:hypothetical protein
VRKRRAFQAAESLREKFRVFGPLSHADSPTP